VPGAVNGDLFVTFDLQVTAENSRATRHFCNEAASRTGRGLRQAIPAIG
jgi:hypothetical protein